MSSWKDRAKKVEAGAAEPATGGSGRASIEGPTPVQPKPGDALRQKTPAGGGRATAWMRGASQGLTSNWSDEALGMLTSAFPSLNQSVGNTIDQWGDIFAGRIPRASDAPAPMSREQATEYHRGLNRQSATEDPEAFNFGAATGGVVQAASPLGRGTFLGQPGLGAALASGALAGAGAAEGGKDLEQQAALGAALSGAGTALGPVVGRGLARLPGLASSLSKPLVTPTQNAKALMSQGVDLTLGQMNPTSTLGQLEAVGTGTSWAGPAIKAMRDEGMQSWQGAVLREGMPPGMEPPPPGMSLQGQQSRAYDGFNDVYAPIRSQEIAPFTVEQVPTPQKSGSMPNWSGGQPLRNRIVIPEEGFKRAVDDPNVLATDDVRGAARRFLDHQLSLVPESAYDPGGKVKAEVVQTMRSNIRSKLREALAGQSPDYKTAGMLANAEEYLTEMMESGLPAESQDALRAADAQYAKHKVIDDTLYRAGDRPGGFTPFDLETAIKKTSEKGSFARGSAGDALRSLSAPAREVFQEPPRTGFALLAATPGVANFVTAPTAYVLNKSPALRSFALGQTPLQGVVRRATTPLVASKEITKAAGAAGEDVARSLARAEALRRQNKKD